MFFLYIYTGLAEAGMLITKSRIKNKEADPERMVTTLRLRAVALGSVRKLSFAKDVLVLNWVDTHLVELIRST